MVIMQNSDNNPGWPSHSVENLPWQQQVRSGTREDRMLRSVDAAIPPLIRDLDYSPPLPVALETESALLTVAQADTDAEGHSVALSRFMIRSESVASSKIERISASALDFAKAMSGSRANASAMSMVAATSALHNLVSIVGERGTFELNDFLDAHQALMAEDAHEATYAGKFRDMQNWIGGSDYSPRNALYVPPGHHRVPELMSDLIEYLNRVDIPVFVQAAIGHAQFESIHPFTDGNGRIGRALISAVLRRRGVTRNAIAPIASGLLARRDDYFASLGAYRRGDPSPVISLLARSADAAAMCSRETITRLKSMPESWTTEIRPRSGSAAETLISAFYDHPVMRADEVESRSKTAPSQAYRALDRLVEAGYIEEITGRKKNRVWVASEVLAELDDLDRRIQAAMN